MAKENNNIIILLAVLAAVLAFVALISVFYSIVYIVSLTGFVTGEANLTIAAETVINISNGTISWGEGRVNTGVTVASLNTSAGSVTNGNWTAVRTGMIIMNKGTINVSIDLASGDGSASSFIGGNSPAYQWNTSNYLTGSCTGTALLGTFFNVNATTGTSVTRVCASMDHLANKNMMEIDFSVVIPEDAAGIKADTITITGTAV